MSAGFGITHGKGFHVTFDNGWTVSVQFGPGNYCENYDLDIIGQENNPQYGKYQAGHAEVAAWDSAGNWYEFEDDKVKGWVAPNELLKYMNMFAAKEATDK